LTSFGSWKTGLAGWTWNALSNSSVRCAEKPYRLPLNLAPCGFWFVTGQGNTPPIKPHLIIKPQELRFTKLLGVMDTHELRNEMDALFTKFLPAEIASRFSGLLAMKPNRWSKIDPWKVWDVLEDPRVVEWQRTWAELLASPMLAKHADVWVTVLRCGHEQSAMERLPLRDALHGPSRVFEGFVSVLPGKLGLAINHDGMICILKA